MTKTPRQEEVLNDLVELLDVDEDQLTTPSRLFTELPGNFIPSSYLIDEVTEMREVKIINTDLTFWIFPSEDLAEQVNQVYARWLVDHGKVDFKDDTIVNAMDSDLIRKYVYKSMLDREDSEKLAQQGPEAFLKGAAKFDVQPKVEETYVPEESVKELQKVVANAASKYPIKFLIDSFGQKQTMDLLINGVGITNDAADRLANEITFNETLKPLNVGNEVGRTRYGLVVVQVIGKPVVFQDTASTPGFI